MPSTFVCQIFTVAFASGAHAALTTLSASRTGIPVQPSETSTRSRSLGVLHGPSVVVATTMHDASGVVNGSGYVAWSVIAAVPPLAHGDVPASTSCDPSGIGVAPLSLSQPTNGSAAAPY